MFYLVKFYGGAIDGLTKLTKTPLPLEYRFKEGTYRRDRKNDKKHVRAYTIKPKTPSI